MPIQSNLGLDVQLQPLRDAIDVLDDKIIALLSERFELVQDVAKVKSHLDAPVLANARFQQIKQRLSALAVKSGLDADMIVAIYETIHIGACQVEQQIVATEGDVRSGS